MDDKEHLNKIKGKAKEAKTVRRIVFITVLAIVVFVAAIIAGGYFYIQSALEPVNPDDDKKIGVEIPRGSSLSDIAQKLDDKGIVKNARIFHYYVKYKNENGFKAGYYEFSPSMQIDQIIDHIQKGKVATVLKIQFPEGIWMTDIAEIIAKKTDYKKQDILKKMKDRKYIKNTYMKDYLFLKKGILDSDIRYPLEGYLFPATYSFQKENPELETIFNKMLSKMGTVLHSYQSKINKSDRSVHEILTLASIIEEEATKQTNRKKISGVFYNRLDKDMLLQTDPSVKYAVKDPGPAMTEKELNVDSPYNTYEHKGLPVGPVANPGKSSIDAAVNPKDTDYLYFYARVNGEIIYSKTNKEHNQVKNKYKDEWQEYIDKKKNKKE